jgi:hypothetical protein
MCLLIHASLIVQVANDVLPPFTTIRCFMFFSKMHVSRRVSVCRFTHFGPYLVHIKISISSYNSEQRK